tara:strand:- start:476 stop:2551 length:2076 start_codon:yes stop_codon:yes gene_type:complete
MRIGVIRYPGSNCYSDTIRYFGKHKCKELWYKIDTIDKDIDLLIIPGGFAFGDRFYEKATDKYEYSPGKMAINSPIKSTILYCYENNIPILGICNGFQILTNMGLLPGKLIENESKKFESRLVKLTYDHNTIIGETNMYIANYYGNYQNEEVNKDNIFLKYDNFENGSCLNIAGIMNDKKTVFGMMPHPERNSDFKDKLLQIIFHDGLIYQKVNNLLTSEHISYKSTKKFLKELHTEEDHVIQGPGENAGIVDIGDGYCITIRIESHNHPTFKNAYEGAATGVGGIIRDIICMGSKPIALLDFLRFGIDDNSKNLLNDAIKGIAYYGNTIGIPTIGGSLHTSEIYNKNPLLNVACLGIVKKENIIYGNALQKNSLLVLCGAKTGNEGVDSAIMASKQLNDEKEKNIQRADAYLENLLLDAFVEISNSKIAEGCQDLGAGGILCATTEVIKRGREKTKLDLGCNIYLDHVPLKHDIDSYSILASETQERMLLVVRPENITMIQKILCKWDLEHNIIGEVTDEGTYNVYHKNKLIFYDNFLNFKEDETNLEINYNEKKDSEINKIKNLSLWSSYDYSIGCRTIKGPDKPGQYSILDIYEINKQCIITWGETVEVCYEKLISLNGIPLGIVNCLNFGDPSSCIGDFKDAVQLMNNSCKKLKIPVLGGNVSMYNSTDNVDIPSTVVIVMIGIKNN